MVSNTTQQQLSKIDAIVKGTPVLILASHVSFWGSVVIAACACVLVLAAHLNTELTVALLFMVLAQFLLTYFQIRLTVVWGVIIEQIAQTFMGLLDED